MTRATMLPPPPVSHVRAVRSTTAQADAALVRLLGASDRLGRALEAGALDHHPAARRERLRTLAAMGKLLLEEIEAEGEDRATWDLELGEVAR